jgi:uncharacterized membrane protein YfcA
MGRVMSIFLFLLIGLSAGVLAGLFGVGGGLIIVPALILMMSFTQSTAAGTSLVALLAPVGFGGAYAFYQAGKIGPEHIKAGLLISIGMFVGSFAGAKLALNFSDLILKRAFCIFLVVVAARLWFTTVTK